MFRNPCLGPTWLRTPLCGMGFRRRAPYDHPIFVSNAAHDELNQRLPKLIDEIIDTKFYSLMALQIPMPFTFCGH